MPMETRHDLEHTTERLTEGLRCPWKWGHRHGVGTYLSAFLVDVQTHRLICSMT